MLVAGQLAGVLQARNGGSRFVPDPAWAAMPAGRRPVLGQRFEERPSSEVRAGQGLPSWFEHALPEFGGPLRHALARSLDVRETTSFAIAAAVGDDLPGAVVLRAVAGPIEAAGRRVLTEPPAPERPMASLRFSLAGVQLKFSARSTSSGLVLGFGGDRIVKLADQRFDEVPANEHAVMSWARASGLDVPPTELLPLADLLDLPDDLALRDDRAFAIQRFDRAPDGTRVHQEDLAQVLGLAAQEGRRDKYEGTNLDTIVRVIAALAPQDVDELISRVVFMVLSANNDMHAKNWSLIYPDGVTPRLAPAYDLLCTDVYVRSGEMASRLAQVRRLDAVGPDAFARLAVRAQLDPTRIADVVATAVERTLDAWPAARPRAPSFVADHLDRWLLRAPLARRRR